MRPASPWARSRPAPTGTTCRTGTICLLGRGTPVCSEWAEMAARLFPTTQSDTDACRGLIDVHHHLVPPAVRARLAAAGVHAVGGLPVPAWREREHLDVLDRQHIATAVVSLSDTGTPDPDHRLARLVAREANEFFAALIARHPSRFGAFAVLPLPDVDATVAELSYASDTLRLDGV